MIYGLSVNDPAYGVNGSPLTVEFIDEVNVITGGRATGDARIPGLRTVSGADSFGEDAQGRVYVVSGSGPVYRFAAR